MTNASLGGWTAMVLAALFVPRPLVTSPGENSGQRQISSCKGSCPALAGFCHWRVALYLLRGYESGLPTCVTIDRSLISTMPLKDRFRLGIEELNQAIADPSGVDAEKVSLEAEKAAAYIDLAHSYLGSGDDELGGEAFENAVQIYRTMRPSQTNASDAPDSVAAVASGLIRAGAPLKALELLRSLPERSPDRLYLSAEALFTLQDRAGAGVYYQQWLDSGCRSELFMLTHDSYGKEWALLLPKSPKVQTKCEQLPAELRSRLEGLRDQFGHPDNIPSHSYPASLFPDHADY